MTGGAGDPYDPSSQSAGLTAATSEQSGNIGEVCQECRDNWVEAGAVDESTGKPLPGLGYRIYDVPSGDLVASGTLDEQGKSPRHFIPLPKTQLYVIFGTEEAMDEAARNIEKQQRQDALNANARKDWQGIPAGLDEGGFNNAFDAKAAEQGRTPQTTSGFFNNVGQGAQRIYRTVSNGFDLDAGEQEFYRDERARAYDEYRVATGAREATRWESFGGGAGQGISFGFSDEVLSRMEASVTGRSYDEIVADRRQLMNAQSIANPGTYMAGEISGSIPSIFVPVGGAAVGAARAGRGVQGAMTAGGKYGVVGGGLAGAGQDEGGFVDRLDGAAVGAATGGLGGAIMGGAGVLIARGVSRTRIWGRVTGRVPPKRQPWENPSLGDEWYDPKTGELIWPNTQTTGYPDGFSAMPVKEELPVGTIIDRYSAKVGELDSGNFLSPAGTSFEARALPWNPATQQYSVYEVVKPLPVDSGTAIPWFGSAGGATQYKTGLEVRDLIKEGYLDPR